MSPTTRRARGAGDGLSPGPSPYGRGGDKAPIERNKEGCLTCRLRRKKCEWPTRDAGGSEEPRPCLNCDRHNIECLGTAEKHPEWYQLATPALKRDIKEHIRNSDGTYLSFRSYYESSHYEPRLPVPREVNSPTSDPPPPSAGTLEEKQTWLLQQRPDMLAAAQIVLQNSAATQAMGYASYPPPHPAGVQPYPIHIPEYNVDSSDATSSSSSPPDSRRAHDYDADAGYEADTDVLTQFIDPVLLGSSTDIERNDPVTGAAAVRETWPGNTFGPSSSIS